MCETIRQKIEKLRAFEMKNASKFNKRAWFIWERGKLQSKKLKATKYDAKEAKNPSKILKNMANIRKLPTWSQSKLSSNEKPKNPQVEIHKQPFSSVYVDLQTFLSILRRLFDERKLKSPLRSILPFRSSEKGN